VTCELFNDAKHRAVSLRPPTVELIIIRTSAMGHILVFHRSYFLSHKFYISQDGQTLFTG